MLTSVALRWLQKRTRPGLFCGVYHAVCDTSPAHIRHLYVPRTPARFREDLTLLSSQFSPVAPTALDAPGFLVTFDDGLRESYDAGRMMAAEFGLRAIYFVNAHFVGNTALFYRHRASLLVERWGSLDGRGRRDVTAYLAKARRDAVDPPRAFLEIGYHDRQHLDALADLMNVDFARYLETARPYLTQAELDVLAAEGHVIGAHGVDHPPFEALSADEQWRQCAESVQFVQDRWPGQPRYFAFPFHARQIASSFWTQSIAAGITAFGTGGYAGDGRRRLVDRVMMERRAPTAFTVGRALFKRWRTPVA